jgi:hypothetical protein
MTVGPTHGEMHLLPSPYSRLGSPTNIKPTRTVGGVVPVEQKTSRPLSPGHGRRPDAPALDAARFLP